MNTRTLFTPAITANLRGLATTATTGCLRGSIRPIAISASRQFSTSRRSQLEFFQPPKNLPNIKLTPPSWPHPGATEEQLKAVEVAHRECRTFGDKTAYNMVRFAKWCTNIATGYSRDPNKPYQMNARKWLVRFIFLETIAGVPGMMGGMIRHFHSLRKMKRDNGWYVLLTQARDPC
jgi:hypothetical protein